MGRIDGNYDVFHPSIQRLFKDIDSRGHKIGVHPSFNTFNDAEEIAREMATFQNCCDQCDTEQYILESRQHFLRWKTPHTAHSLNNAGVLVDHSLAFADHVGFRCGTCFSYPFYDVLAQRVLSLNVQPLIVMEASMFEYQGLNDDEAIGLVSTIRQRCMEVGGVFTLLWHNSFIGLQARA